MSKSKYTPIDPTSFYASLSGAMATAKSAKAAYDSLSSSFRKHAADMSKFGTQKSGARSPGKKNMRQAKSRAPLVTYSSAPAAVGSNLRGARWNFGSAPDVGLGPGLRLTGHTYLCQVYQQENKVDSIHHFAPFTNSVSVWDTSGGQTAGNGRATVALDPSTGALDTNNTCIGVFSGNTALRALVQCFERFHFSKCRLIYTPADSSATTGAFSVGYEVDPARAYLTASAANVSGGGFTVPLNLPGSASTSFWQPCAWDAKLAPAKAAADLFYVDSIATYPTDTTSSTEHGLGIMALNRQTSQGMFMGFTTATPSGDEVQHGFITVEFAIDLYCTNFYVSGVGEPSPTQERKFISTFDLQLHRERKTLEGVRAEVLGLVRASGSRSLVREERKSAPEDADRELGQTKASSSCDPPRSGLTTGWVELRSPQPVRRQ